MMQIIPTLTCTALMLLTLSILGCASDGFARPSVASTSAAAPGRSSPPPEIQAWMDRLTVAHEYAPDTGFIVAKETITLSPLLAEAPPLDEAIRLAADERVVIAFATADRCAPCQQFKKDALNDPRVIARLGSDDVIATHVEVDRETELTEVHLGGAAIPMSYALRSGEVTASLRGQRSAEELLTWLDEVIGEG